MTDTKAREALAGIKATMATVEWPEDWPDEFAAITAALDRLDDLVALATRMRSDLRDVDRVDDPHTRIGMYRGMLVVLLGDIEKARGE